MEIMIMFLDLCNTLLEGLLLYACAEIVCKKNRQTGMRRYIPYIGISLVCYLTTWVVPLDTIKIMIEMIVWCLLMKVTTGGKWRNFIVAFLIYFYIFASVSFFEMTACHLVLGTNTMVIGEQVFLSWWDYVFAAIIKIVVSAGLLVYRKHFQYEIQLKDTVLIGAVSLIFYMVCFSFGVGFFEGNKEWFDMTSATGTMLFSLCFLLLLLFYKNNIYLKEQNQEANRQAKEAQMHYQYYLEKEKQEKKVRSIYHDMKNHLLILESGQMSDEARQMAERLRNEISDYESYIQSGNRFLDIILSDKAQKAKDGQVDFSAFVDFSEITFIDPLDISTIFGNGIDNALEACEKLPPEKRIVVVKGCKKEKFALILIENNYPENGDVGKRMTNKEDAFWHGFGIPNIERAVQKYEGECKVMKKNGRFTLTIIIPFPVSARQ